MLYFRYDLCLNLGETQGMAELGTVNREGLIKTA